MKTNQNRAITILAAFVATFPLLHAQAEDEPAANSGAPTVTFEPTAEQKEEFKARRAEISKSKALWAEAFKYRDKDADGILTYEEAQAHANKHARKHNEEPKDCRPHFDAWDSNSDGVVLIAEMEEKFPGWLQELREAKKAEK